MNTGSRRLAGISCISALNEHIARVEGFAARCRELDRSCKLFIRQGTWGKLTEEFVAELLDWLHSGDLPAALFCSDDISAARIIRELQTAGLHVPEDVAVLGCEDNQLICESSFPRLSSVHPPYRQVGFEAARKLDALFRGENLQQKSLWLPVDEISERMSTSLFAVDDIQLRRAFEYIRRHACEKISVNDVARHAGLTVTTLQRRFREKAGSSPNAEIQRARLDRVKEMLRAGSFTLDEIAEVTGYPSGPYLSKIFKRKTGQTVREYRVRCDPRRI
jgi:LacI family transcriptional regulator